MSLYHKLFLPVVLVFCCFTCITKAQTETDLAKLNKKYLDAKTSIQKIDILNDIAIAHVYGKNDSVKVWYYCNLLFDISEKVNNNMGKGISYYLKAIYFMRKRQYKTALDLFQKSAVYSHAANHIMNYGNAYAAMGQCYGYLGQYDNAINAHNKAKEIYAQKPKLRKLLLDTYTTLFKWYEFRGNYNEAITDLFAALKISEAMPEKPSYNIIMIDLGNMYWRLKQFNKAKQYYQMAADYAIKTKNDIELGNSYSGIGLIYLEQDNMEMAKKYLEQSLQLLANHPKESLRLGRVYNNLGGINLGQGNYNEAIINFKKTLEYTQRTNDVSAIIKVHSNIASAYAKLGNLDEAEKWLALARKYDLSVALPYALSALYNRMAIVDSLKGDYKNAMVNQNLHNIYEAKDANLVVSQQINEINTKYETEKKEAQISLLNKEKSIDLLKINNQSLQLLQKQQVLDINQLKIKNQNQQLLNQNLITKEKEQHIKNLKRQNEIQNLELTNNALQIKQRNITLTSLCLLFSILALLGYSYYKRHKIKLQNEIYQQQELATKALFEGEQNERIRIARDLHDSIGQMLSVVKMNLSNLQRQQPENQVTDNTAQLVDNAIDEVRHISHNLIPEELNFGLFNAIEDLCDKITATGTITTLNVPDQIKNYPFTKQTELSIYRIVQEVLNNMVKHAHASKIDIEVIAKEHSFSIGIKDNGQGFDPQTINQSKGMGWKNISARVNLLNGKLNVLSEKLSGTQIEITLPA